MTNWFEQYYPELIDYAKAIIYNKKLQVEAEDLVNDAYIKFVEGGKEFDLLEVKRIISGESYKELTYSLSKTNFGDRIFKRGEKKGDICCYKCHEVKPVGAFRIKQFNGFIFVYNICRNCEVENSKEWFKKNKDKWNEYMRWWHQNKGGVDRKTYLEKLKANARPIHELWNKANKKYQQKQKEGLTDIYIRGILKASKKDFSPQAIELKRKELQEKRREANILTQKVA